ncbi:MAG TPA: translation elongation factor Ts [Spirochaetota bacterium]|nr:translation elongation factor Ts [Spirochaetota bacterium]OQA99726.1 MAG: Elongation factor Ts [Spirochaetes bacterium ADurb.Bin218]HOK01404.1 translation elongation factor Ts [Spirochaetota bacterium]HOK92094.1 translation elongation factor Ts [Spirochaetota bacterium]HON17408.1 translation elongation factor Ts [Spirochaetota bacterium]
MAEITSEMIKELRDKTQAGMMDCKKALTECGGDMEKAVEFLRKKGLASADKKAGTAVSEGIVASYIHSNNKIGVLLELKCATDFVARNEDFQNLAKEIAMQIAAANPLYVSPEDVPADVIAKEKEIYKEQMKDSGKPDNVIEKIVEGKLSKFYSEVCLLEQEYIKDSSVKIRDLIKQKIAVFGENIEVGKFARFQIGN